MKPLLTLAALFVSGVAYAQDDLDEKIKELAQKLAKEGASAKLAGLSENDHGRQAIKEKIELLVSCRTGRFERDSQGTFEDFLFKTEADGSLALRPDRLDVLERMNQAAARAPKILEAFNRRLDALVSQIGETVELDRRVKGGLKDPEIRLALFHHHVGEVRESDPEEILDQILTKALVRKPDGKLHMGGLYAQELKDRIRATYEQLDSVKDYQSAYLNAIAKVNDLEMRQIAESEAARVFILGRIIRESQEGVEDRTGDLAEGDADNNVEKAVTLNKEMALVLERFKAFSRFSEDVNPLLEKITKEVADERADEIDVLLFLKNERARPLLIERMLALKESQSAKADAVFSQIKEDWFIAAGGKLGVKAGRFVDENKVDSPDAAGAELQTFVNELKGARSGLDQIAERLSDASLVALFEKREATFVLNDQIQEVVQLLSDPVGKEGLAIFVKLYLAPRGDQYIVRPERANRIDELVRRAEAIRKEAEKAGQNP